MQNFKDVLVWKKSHENACGKFTQKDYKKINQETSEVKAMLISLLKKVRATKL